MYLICTKSSVWIAGFVAVLAISENTFSGGSKLPGASLPLEMDCTLCFRRQGCGVFGPCVQWAPVSDPPTPRSLQYALPALSRTPLCWTPCLFAQGTGGRAAPLCGDEQIVTEDVGKLVLVQRRIVESGERELFPFRCWCGPKHQGIYFIFFNCGGGADNNIYVAFG